MSSPHDDTANAIDRVFGGPETYIGERESANVVDALFAIADQLHAVALALHALGTNQASSPMGAIELLSSEVKRIADFMERENTNDSNTTDDPPTPAPFVVPPSA